MAGVVIGEDAVIEVFWVVSSSYFRGGAHQVRGVMQGCICELWQQSGGIGGGSSDWERGDCFTGTKVPAKRLTDPLLLARPKGAVLEAAIFGRAPENSFPVWKGT